MKPRKTKKNRRQTRTLSAQKLQTRKLMAADFFSITPDISYDDGVVEISGSYISDEVSVDVLDNGTTDPSDDMIQIEAHNAWGSKSVTLLRQTPDGDNVVDEVVFRGYNGNDRFENNTDIRSRAYGGNGNDVLIGGMNVDRFFGQAGDDSIYGRDGSDRLYGGTGNDMIQGGNGDDLLNGSAGVDRLFGQLGDDEILGGADGDYLYGSHGDDQLRGGSGNDFLYGNAGQDRVHGGSGNDLIRGGTGHDTLIGDTGDDTIFGDKGRDLIDGGVGDDAAYGGDDDDIVIGGDGADWLEGQAGDDTLYAGKMSIDVYDYTAPGGFTILDDMDDDDDDVLFGGAGQDSFFVGDYGFLNWGNDDPRDLSNEDSLIHLDPWGVDFSEHGVPLLQRFGHLAE